MYPNISSSESQHCFCDPWGMKPAGNGILGTYTDRDFAAEMNALSFVERQAVEDDIHGVAEDIQETPEFIADRIGAIRQALTEVNSAERQAWDRAVFLRPALDEDQSLYLLFLRARQFRAVDAAVLMTSYFRAKRDLWGEDLLIHRITWDHLTEQEQSIFRSGAYRLIPNHDRKGRGIVIVRMAQFNISDNYRAMARCIWYVLSALNDDPSMQQKGIVTVADYGGKWISSPFQFVRLLSTFPWNAMPIRDVGVHCIYNDSSKHEMIQVIRNLLRKEIRMRFRLHFGSPVETEYALRTFGIDISRQLYPHRDPVVEDGHDDASIEEDILRRQRLDDEWRRSETPYCESTSSVARFPNPQDIIMGRNKTVAERWSGNILFRNVIQQYVQRYIEAQNADSFRVIKTMISIEILHVLKNDYKSRFLARKHVIWHVIDDSEAQSKISQALRMLARDTR